MNNRELIVRSLEWIEVNLKSGLSIKTLSAEAGYSLYHYIRLFQAVTGMTPGDYIARRRITEAAFDIQRMPERSFHDISLDYQFNDYETFTRSFKRILHTSPSHLRCRQVPALLPLMHRLEERDLLHLPLILGKEPDIVDLDAVILQGPLVSVTEDHSVIADAWQLLFSNIARLPARSRPESYYQLGLWPDHYENSGVSFLCACALDQLNVQSPEHGLLNEAEHAPADFPVHTLPAARYLRFIHQGLSRDVPMTYKYIYETWLPRSEYRLSLPFEFEYYGSRYLGPDNKDSISEIYIPLQLL
ncbi:helix-turn-helix domain-containing protein [Paenibacillus sp. MMS20-IR301]|uniref:AraC family transcriptional regulator n=1 Tax=Paenibacillus sp. MMS20-IR301 TaxID=2895946 RepID=UPI0028E38793|nr:helix-turn-helix domain-containing protein [Paenibacillus sp. MMS20-IR301]WNS41622.1 helix-turn-helix domain-containing protein [Paenibacillus sp. MMS20-IR301]